MLQAIGFASISTAFRAATDSVQGINRRFQALPIASLTPLAARISASVYRCCDRAGRRAGMWLCHRLPIPPRAVLHRGRSVCWCCSPAWRWRSWRRHRHQLANPAATAQWLLLPQLIFGYLSVGIQPVHRFPEWIQPIVRDQPISQIVYALHALAGTRNGNSTGHLVGGQAGSGLVVGMIALTLPWAIAVYRRRS